MKYIAPPTSLVRGNLSSWNQQFIAVKCSHLPITSPKTKIMACFVPTFLFYDANIVEEILQFQQAKHLSQWLIIVSMDVSQIEEVCGTW